MGARDASAEYCRERDDGEGRAREGRWDLWDGMVRAVDDGGDNDNDIG